MVDYHVHSNYSVDAIASLEENIKKAIELNMSEICFTDHIDYEKSPYIREVPFLFDIDKFFKEINILKKKYKSKIKIVAGVEIGMQPDVIDNINKLINNYEFDFLLGSIHNVSKVDLYSDKILEGPIDEVWTKYFEEMLECIRAIDKLNSIGHFDLPKRYNLKFKPYDIKADQDLIETIFKEMIERKIALEINTGGFSYGLDSPNPSIDFIDLYISLGGELFTIGSDSHSVEQLGRDLYKGYKVLYDKGIKEIVVFENQEIIFKNIEKYFK
ncbi:MAG: histidinol-phosphatase HisJ family protein [Clostridia bacterium]